MKISRTLGTACAALALFSIGKISYAQDASPAPSAAPSAAAGGEHKGPHGPGGGEGKARMEKMEADLGLTDDQKAKFKTAMQDQGEKIRALRADTTLTPEQKKEKMGQIHKDFQESLKSFLTPEQVTKLEELRKQHGPHAGGPKAGGEGTAPATTGTTGTN